MKEKHRSKTSSKFHKNTNTLYEQLTCLLRKHQIKSTKALAFALFAFKHKNYFKVLYITVVKWCNLLLYSSIFLIINFAKRLQQRIRNECYNFYGWKWKAKLKQISITNVIILTKAGTILGNNRVRLPQIFVVIKC